MEGPGNQTDVLKAATSMNCGQEGVQWLEKQKVVRCGGQSLAVAS